jgi:predicted transcriptional regulator YheO
MIENIPENPSPFGNGQKAPQQKHLHLVLEGIRQILPGLASAIGPDCELVLHDFRDVRHSLIAIEGNITGRILGSPLTDLILQVIRKDDNPKDLLNYQSQTHNGHIIRSSTLFFRDLNGKVIGCMCVNRNLSGWLVARNLLDEFCETYPLESDSVVEGNETFVQDVEELLMGTINEVIALEKKPVKYMDKSDKVRVVNELDARGIFLIRGSVKTVARALNVSRYTIYNYLDEGRR